MTQPDAASLGNWIRSWVQDDGIADAVSMHPDPRAVALLRRLVRFQTGSFQDNGYYAHIGFQVRHSGQPG